MVGKCEAITGKYVTSFDGENFNGEEFDIREEAIKALREDGVGGYVGEEVEIEFSPDDFNWEAEYYLSDMLYNEVGDVSETWSLSEDDERELNQGLGKAMVDFLNAHHLQPSCYKVINIEGIDEADNR